MAHIYQTISSTNETAISIPSNGVKYESLLLVNNHASADITLDLYIKDSSATTFYILNNVKIANGVSLKLDADEFNFNRTVYTLYINTDNAAGGIDVIINR